MANATASLITLPGGVASAWVYRGGSAVPGKLIWGLVAMSVAGGVIGSQLLLHTPSERFARLVPYLMLGAALVFTFSDPLRRFASRHTSGQVHNGLLYVGMLAISIYGGYFGAAQGILILGLLGLSLPDPLQRINAIKNIVAGLTNATAGVVFLIAASHVAWEVAGLIAVGSALGAQLGARVGRSLPEAALRVVIVAVGIAAILKLVL